MSSSGVGANLEGERSDSARGHYRRAKGSESDLRGLAGMSGSGATDGEAVSMQPSQKENTYMAKLVASDQERTDTHGLLGVKRPKARKTKWQTRCVKLLVVGDSGLGKTTLVRCLLAVPGEPIELHDGSSTDFKEFKKDPSVYLSSVTWDDEEEHVKWTYQIQDTPGYGDDLDIGKNITRIRKYIEDQNELWHKIESSPQRKDLSKEVDPRVDLCIFCLPPHRVRNIDMLFMQEVSKLVPILPVVTKADTMTVKEGVNYRRDINSRMQHPTTPIHTFTFSQDTLEACGVSDNAIASVAAVRPPYLVVCSNTNNEERARAAEPELWPERRYMWGTSEAMNPQHSDLLLLRRLLLQEGVEEIATSKIERYEEWRTRTMKQLKPLRKLAGALLTTAVVVAVGWAGKKAYDSDHFKTAKDTVKDGLKEAKDAAADNVGGAANVVTDKLAVAADKTASKIEEKTGSSKLRELPGVPEKKKKVFGIF